MAEKKEGGDKKPSCWSQRKPELRDVHETIMWRQRVDVISGIGFARKKDYHRSNKMTLRLRRWKKS